MIIVQCLDGGTVETTRPDIQPAHRAAALRKLVPIEDLYADLIAAVNRGDLPGAQTLAARIAA